MPSSRSFARAATQGVFDFPSISAPLGEDGTLSPLGRGLTPVTDPMDGVSLPDADGFGSRPGLILRTGLARGDDGTPEAQPGQVSCTRVGSLASGGWIDGDADFFSQIAGGRFAMTTETGRFVPEAVVAQAQRYIAFGFGLEAADLLQLLGDDIPANLGDEVRSIRTLANIVDGGDAPDSAIARAIGCSPEAAFWATLARGTLDGTGDAHRDATLVGFRDLPQTLRGHLGLRLAGMFSVAGEHLIASTILTEAIGEVTGGGLDAEMAGANLAGAEHGPDAEIARLGEIATRNPRTAPETIVRLLDLTAEAGRATPPSVLDLAEAVRHEAGSDSVGAELARAEVRALIVSADFGAALFLIDVTADVLGPERQAALTDDAIAGLAAGADNSLFLDLALATGRDAISPVVQNAVAARLLDIGFPDLAQPFLYGSAERDVMRERRYLRGAAAAALGDVAGADLALEGMTDPRAQDIRAVARTIAGDYTGAYEARDLADPSVETDAAAWRAGDWTGLELSQDPLLSGASRAILSPPAPPGLTTPLADRQTLLDEASDTREMTEALLEQFIVDAGDGS